MKQRRNTDRGNEQARQITSILRDVMASQKLTLEKLEIMTKDQKELIERFNAATNATADKLQKLVERHEDESDPDFIAGLNEAIGHLQAIGADSENPIPTPLPVATPPVAGDVTPAG